MIVALSVKPACRQLSACIKYYLSSWLDIDKYSITEIGLILARHLQHHFRKMLLSSWLKYFPF